jgi:RNA polymerase-binding transcription factor DksA
MKKTEAKPFKEVLLQLRDRLCGDVQNMADAALNKTRSEASGDLSTMPIHMADIGSDNYEQGLTLSLLESEEVVLGQVQAALERIDTGVYGLCDECEGKIPKIGRAHV